MTKEELNQSLRQGGVELSDRKLDAFFCRLGYIRFLMKEKGLFAQHPDPAKREYIRVAKEPEIPVLVPEHWA